MNDPRHIRTVLVQALTDVQLASGRPAPLITDATVPDHHLPGFKSMNWIEVTVIVCAHVGTEIDLIPWVDPVAGHHRTVGEIVRALAPLFAATDTPPSRVADAWRPA